MSQRLVEAQLPSWLRGATLDPHQLEIDTNLARVSAIVAALEPGNVFDLLAYAYARADGGENVGFQVALTAVRSAGEEDSVASEQDLLPRRLSAIAVADLLDQSHGDAAVIAGLAVRSIEFCDGEHPLPELPQLADVALARIATERRRRPPAFSGSIQDEVEALISKATVAEAETVDNGQLRGALEKVRAAVRRSSKGIDAMREASEYHARITDEELDLLWWSHGNHSQLLAKRWPDVSEAATLVAPFELAERLLIQPAPRSASFLVATVLGRAGLDSAGPKSLRKAVEAAPILGGKLAGLSDPYKLLPISSAIAEHHKKSGDGVWAAAYKAEFGLDPASKYGREALAAQFVSELSLTALLDRGAPNES